MSTPLAKTHCVPCEHGTPPLTRERVVALLAQVPDWELRNGPPMSIARTIACKNFKDACAQFLQVALLCEEEGHHTDFHLTNWKHLDLVLTTHAIGGLSENDFIMAANINALLSA